MLAAEIEPAKIDRRRRAQRAPVSLDAKLDETGIDQGRLDRGGLGRALCKVVDVSLHGARLVTYSALRKGMAVWLTVPGIDPIAAEVMWADDFAAGCRFHAPLARTALDDILARDGTLAAH